MEHYLTQNALYSVKLKAIVECKMDNNHRKGEKIFRNRIMPRIFKNSFNYDI